ncbi:hypothetical protein [Leifsonia poae]|uniref:hypothetical protein n=1 Tax=Leifsonia poae TaxID=110933 RepID=UPI001CBFC5DF|nr:hypothetical protein [Leifsonia poae]
MTVRTAGSVIAAAEADRIAAAVTADCLTELAAARVGLTDLVIDHLQDRSREPEAFDVIRSCVTPAHPGFAETVVRIGRVDGAVPTVCIRMTAGSDETALGDLFGWTLALLGADWFYGCYVDERPAGGPSIAVYLNVLLQPVIPAASLREAATAVPHLLG